MLSASLSSSLSALPILYVDQLLELNKVVLFTDKNSDSDKTNKYLSILGKYNLGESLVLVEPNKKINPNEIRHYLTKLTDSIEVSLKWVFFRWM